MKTLRFLSFAVVAALINSCAELTSVDNADEQTNTIAAVMEGIQSKTSTTDEGRFSWSYGDNIWIETTSGNVLGTLSTGAGTTNANFTFGAFVGELTGKAVYPHNTGHSVEEDVLNVFLPESYNLGSNLENTNAPMYGVNVNGTLKFNHLAGVMRFAFKNVPVGVDRFTITVDKKINGTFTADLTSDFPVLESSMTEVETEKTVTLNFDALEVISDINLYMPLPLGEYTTLALGLFKGEESIWEYSNTVTNTIRRKTLKLMPSVTLGGSIGGEIESDNVPAAGPADYVDEYGVNHGQGVKIGETTWAPVNCGYHATDYKYGKLYQWGRKYGQGYDGDATVPTIGEGRVLINIGNNENNSNVFYSTDDSFPDEEDWAYTSYNELWNAGTESNPIKTEYDPCPSGWRVPTQTELEELSFNYSSLTTDENGQSGYWFSGETSYREDLPQVFLPAAGARDPLGAAFCRGQDYCFYWSSSPSGNMRAMQLLIIEGELFIQDNSRVYGYAIRCVKDSSETDIPNSEDTVEIECMIGSDRSGTKSIGIENNTLSLTGPDYVDVNGIDYPVNGDGTNRFIVKVPKSDSYTISYPADAVTLNSDGTYLVDSPNQYEGPAYGVHIGTVNHTESLICNLEAIHGLVKVRMSNTEDWRQIVFQANCGTSICGDAVLNSEYNITSVINGVDTITIVRGSGDSQDLYFPLLPCSLSGITLTIYKSDGTQITKTSNNVLNLQRGYIMSLGNL